MAMKGNTASHGGGGAAAAAAAATSIPDPHCQYHHPSPIFIENMISQLSFSTDIPIDKTDDQAFHYDFVFPGGLFCMSFDESDNEMYYDAVEIYDGHDDVGGNSRSEYEGNDTTIATSTAAAAEVSDDDESVQAREFPATSKNLTVVVEDEQEEKEGELVETLRGGAQHEQEGLNGFHTPVNNNKNSNNGVELNKPQENPFEPLPPPPPPKELPDRFLRAGKGDPVEGQRRYEETLKWRKEYRMDTILTEYHPNFEIIKKNYPHYFHLRGKQNEPVFFEQPPKTNLKAMRQGGVTMDGLLRHYAMVTEFGWQYLERDDFAQSITVIDLEGMGMRDFVGDCVEYVRKCSAFTGDHYPERAGYILVINTPGWFQWVWNVIKPMVDEATLAKVDFVRGKDAILQALEAKIPLENIPPEYGGQSMPLGQSPEELLMKELMEHNKRLAAGDHSCGGRAANPPCRFDSFVPVRSY